MFFVKLMGGLGNQMFQYAFGKQQAFEAKLSCHYDLSFFQDQHSAPGTTIRNLELDIFNIKPKYVNLNSIKNRILIRKKIRNESDLNLTQINTQDKDCFVGYFQSEFFFRDVKDELRRDFKFLSISPKTIQLQELIQSFEETVSLHVRRGDYFATPEARKVHGVIDENYYRNSLQLMKQKLGKKFKLIVFSDELDWVKRNLDIKNAIYVEHNKGSDSFQDMYLMSLCKNNIIANSSFSWWAGWLNTYPNKVVIAPALWFGSGISSKGIVPDGWLRI